MVSKERLIHTFLELAKTDSPTFGERKIADIVTRHLKNLGLSYEEDDTGKKIGGDTGNIICRIPGDKDKPTIAILAHMDTVTPCLNKNPIIENDIIKTNGKTILGGDDHAGVAAMLELLYVLFEQKIAHGELVLIFTVAEEKGLLGSKHLDTDKLGVKYAFILDDGGPVGTVTYQAPSQNGIRVHIKGKAAHAGVEPEKGVSAITVFAHALSNMKLGRIDAVTTANIGMVQAGSATNIVCENLEAFGEARSLDETALKVQTEHMEACFLAAAKAFGATLEFEVQKMYQTFEISTEHEIFAILQRAAKDLDIRLNPVRSGGGSDTNNLNAKGIPAVNLSVAMEKVHTLEECLDIAAFTQAAEFLVAVVRAVVTK